MTATSQIVDGKMEPINKTESTQQLVVTGQYLYDQFIVADEGQKTRMAIIRDLVEKADAIQIKGACDSLVKLAKQRDKDAGVPEKQRGPKENTAMNVRTFFQTIWGALKFAPEEMKAMGYTPDTGWQESRNMAKAALQRAGKVWQGHDVPTESDRANAALQRVRKAETDAYMRAMKDNPRRPDEADQDWFARVSQQSTEAIAEAKEKAANDAASSYVKKIMDKHGSDVAFRVMLQIADHLNIAFTVPSELTPEEVDKRLKEHAEAEETANAVEEQ